MRALLVLVMTSSAFAEPRIDALMKPWTGTATPGCAVGVIQDGKVVHAKGYGMADLERGVPITPSTLFDIGSTSKQFTAATILLLAAEGKLKLDDDIRLHLPELPALTRRPVTIRHLIHHNGGLRDYEGMFALRGRRIEDVTTSRETVEMLARSRGVDFEPGARFEYSNTGYFLLAQIAERVDKRPFRDQVQERIFGPVGMTSSQIFDDHRRIIVGRALAYGPRESGGWQFDTSQWEQTGDGSVLTSVLDLAKWDAHFYAPKIGGKALLDAQLERGKLADGKQLEYAAGLFHGTYRDQPVVMHSGGWAGYRAELMRFPAQKTTVIVLCNAASARPTALAHHIADVVLATQLGPVNVPAPATTPPAVTLSKAEVDAWIGRYRERSTGDVMTIRREGAGVQIEYGGTRPLEPASKGELRLGPVVRLVLGGQAPARTITWKADHEQTFDEIPAYAPTAAELAARAGRYWSPELNVIWTLRVANHALILDTVEQTAIPLVTSKAEAANSEQAIVLVFQRGPRGIRGFAGSVGGLRKLVFERL